jgi:hypothetical protein
MPAYYGDFVTPESFATVTDLTTYTGGAAPANATALLRSATTLVLRETRQAYYDVDVTTGLATDAQISGALNLATVVQAAAWAAIGFDPLTGGVITPSVATSKKIGSASVQFADAALSAAARADALTRLVPEAERILELQNLLIPNPWTFG